jgi:type I restriction enzyme S subunit
MAMEKFELPAGWEWKKVGDKNYFILVMGQSPPSSTYNIDGVGLPFFQGKAEFGELHPLPRKYCTEPSRVAQKDDILISVRAPVGPTNLATEECGIGRGLAAIRCTDKIMPRFLLYALRSLETTIAGSVQDQGGGFTAIKRDQLEDVQIPVLPLPEQRRIVARIEELTRRVEEAKKLANESLTELGTFTPALLAKAFRGEL